MKQMVWTRTLAFLMNWFCDLKRKMIDYAGPHSMHNRCQPQKWLCWIVAWLEISSQCKLHLRWSYMHIARMLRYGVSWKASLETCA